MSADSSKTNPIVPPESTVKVDDFVQADVDANCTVMPPRQQSSTQVMVAPDAQLTPFDKDKFLADRRTMVQEYFGGPTSLQEKLDADGKLDFESRLCGLINEIVNETNHLLGNELMATSTGNLRDASVIAFKRAETLEKAIKSFQAKIVMDRQIGKLDLDSPAMMVVFGYFMSKSKKAFETLGYGSEISDAFFRVLGSSLEEWKRELRIELDEIKSGTLTIAKPENH